MASQEKNCYLVLNGKKAGPVSEADIQKLYVHKKITDDTKFARVGATEWITVAESGIIALPPLPPDDGLPPLPQENEPVKNIEVSTNETKPNTTTKTPAKKSKLGFIAAGLGVAVVAVAVFMVVIIGNMGSDTNIPTNNMVQGNNPVATSTTDDSTQTTTVQLNSPMTFSTFHVPYSNVIFDYPSYFVYEGGYFDGNNEIEYEFWNPDLEHDASIMFAFLTYEDRFNMNPGTSFATMSHLDRVEWLATNPREQAERRGNTFELLGTIETENGAGIYFSEGGNWENHIFGTYMNSGFYDVFGNLRVLGIDITYHQDHVEDFGTLFQAIIGSIRYDGYGDSTVGELVVATQNFDLPTLTSVDALSQIQEIVDLLFEATYNISMNHTEPMENDVARIEALIRNNPYLMDRLRMSDIMGTRVFGRQVTGISEIITMDYHSTEFSVEVNETIEINRFGTINNLVHHLVIVINSPTDYYLRDVTTETVGSTWDYPNNEDTNSDSWSGDSLSLEELRIAAEQGQAPAQNDLGVRYALGNGVPQDYVLASQWYRRAAEQGHPQAQNNLGFFYMTGNGVEQNDELAVQWFRRAAEQGVAHAQTNLGFLYENGRGVPQDFNLAEQWYRMAAEQGDTVAQSNLDGLIRWRSGFVGRWVSPSGMFYEFRTDGTVSHTGALLTDTYHGTWELIGGNTIRITRTDGTVRTFENISVVGNSLYLSQALPPLRRQ